MNATIQTGLPSVGKIQRGGYVPLKQQMTALIEAGKKLVMYRQGHDLTEINGETVQVSIYGKLYHDNLDTAELQKKTHEYINNISRKGVRRESQKTEKTDLAGQALESAESNEKAPSGASNSTAGEQTP